MDVFYRLKMAVDRREQTPVIYAVQGDQHSRFVEIFPTYMQQPWTGYKGSLGFVRFKKSDGTGGIYDTLPDGSSAISEREESVWVELAPQVLSAPGNVTVQIEFLLGSQSLSTFSFIIDVQENPAYDAVDRDDYINLTSLIAQEIEKNVNISIDEKIGGTIDLINEQIQKNVEDIDALEASTESILLDIEKIMTDIATGAAIKTPVFDLSKMGLPPLTSAGMFSSVPVPTEEIITALNNGPVSFIIPISIEEQVQNATVVVGGSTLSGNYEHYFISGVFGDPIAIRLMINSMGVFVMGLHLPTVAGLPMIQEGDEGKFLSVSSGMFTLVSPTGAETPVFDLGALGLSAVPLTGGSSVVETDTTEIRAALDKGAVIFVIPVSAYGTTMSATLTMNGGKANGSYQCISVTNMTEMATVTVNITDTMVQVVFASLEGSAPISIDLSNFESEGKIIETFPDSVKTTVMEFNSDGKPTKITDSNGNVTTLTW